MNAQNPVRIFIASAVLAAAVPGFPQGGLSASEVFRRCQTSVVRVETDRSVGTGFLIKDGRTVATCFHVLAGGNQARIATSDGKVFSVEKVQYDEKSDIAIATLSVESSSKPIQLSSGPVPEPGTPIHVIGNPLGDLVRTLSSGSVSAIRKEDALTLIQITAPVSPGSSGSPVLNSTAEVVGLVSATRSAGQLLNFAVPAAAIRQTLSNEAVAWSNFADRFKKAHLPTPSPSIDLTSFFIPTFNSLTRADLAQGAAARRLADSKYQSQSAGDLLTEKFTEYVSLWGQAVKSAREVASQPNAPPWATPYLERITAIEEIARETLRLQSDFITGFRYRSPDIVETVRAYNESSKRLGDARRDWERWVWQHDDFRWIRFMEESDPACFYTSTARALVGASPDPAFKFEARVLYTWGDSPFKSGDIIVAVRFSTDGSFEDVISWKDLKLMLLRLPDSANGSSCRVRVRRDRTETDIDTTIKW